MHDIKLSHISTSCLLRMLLRNLWMIVAAAMIFFMSTSLYLNTLWAPRYQATMTYAVRARNTSYSINTSTNATKEVASVFSKMLPTNMVTDRIRAYDPALADYSGAITAAQVGSSNFIVVKCQAGSPREALMALLALEEIFPDIAYYISSNAVVLVIRDPSVSSTPINAVDTARTAAMAAALGGGLMTVLLVWLFLCRETVQTRTGARHLLDAEILAYVGRVRRRRRESLQVFSPTIPFAYTEQINTICTQLEYEHTAHDARVFLITGVGENEGKSTIAGNVAAALALRGHRVAVIDCDLRNPSLKQFFNNQYKAPIPLNEFLSRPFRLEALTDTMVQHKTLGLYMLFSHHADPRCTELLTSRCMMALLARLRVCDYVIMDTPPMGYFADTEALIDSVDASMLVVRQDRTPACDINDAIDLLRRSKSRFLGCILNDMTGTLTEGYHYGYGDGYGGDYGYGSHAGNS